MNENYSAREQALIDRGYDPGTVSRFSSDVMNCAAEIARKIVEREFTDGFERVRERPACVLLGGQPGSGKSCYSRALIRREETRYCVIGLDDFRCFHPGYTDIEAAIRQHWIDREVTLDDSPGNDIADFTHRFASAVSDMVIDQCLSARRNMIIEWGLRTPNDPLRLMKRLKEAGYFVAVRYIAEHRASSFEACGLRADIMNGYGHIMRRVSRQFHELAVSMLPDSCAVLHNTAVLENGWCDEFKLVDRNGVVLWDREDSRMPGEFYRSRIFDVKEERVNSLREAQLSAIAEMRGLRFYSNGEEMPTVWEKTEYVLGQNSCFL